MKIKAFLFIIITLLIFSLPYRVASAKSDFNHQKPLAFSEEKLNKYINLTIKELNTSSKFFTKQKIGSFISSRLAIFKSIDTISNDPILIRQGMYGFWKLARKAALLPLKTNIETKDIASKNFKHFRGKNLKERFTEKSFSILNFNVCFTPDHMPIFFGGMLPWEDRIDNVVKFINEQDADIICLQEVFDYDAHEALYNKLKTKYSHFYTHIGPWHFDGSLSSLGFESGLFVASKYPIKNPIFHPFKNDNPHINRGVFSFDIATPDGKSAGSIFTTHLEPFENGKTLREKELTQIIALMQSKNLNEAYPVILCGDLNLPPNEAKKWINTYFEDSIDINNMEVSKDNLTSYDFTTKRLAINDELKPEYLDYMLLLKNNKDNNSKMKTSIIKTFDTEHINKSLSDHNALFSEIIL